MDDYITTHMMLTQNVYMNTDTGDSQEEWRRYRRQVANGEVLVKKIVKHHPNHWTGSLLKTMFRQTFNLFWFGDEYVDCLYRAYSDRDRIGFKIICQYYDVRIDALRILRMIITQDKLGPVSVLTNRDYKRAQKLIKKLKNVKKDRYLRLVDKKIQHRGKGWMAH